MPRSGTTWLARALAERPGTALPGREPMNPRGRQFGLGGTLSTWTRLSEPTAAQARLLRRAYAGREPRTFSRYGIRQWSAPLPHIRVIVKDPFALLSLAVIGRLTGAVPVVLVRHPAAVLVSYRRMGWSPDIDDIVALGAKPPRSADDVAAMATFWSFCYESALQELAELGRGVLVEHEHLSAGGGASVTALAARLSLPVTSVAGTGQVGSQHTSRPRTTQLHDFERPPEDIAHGWRTAVTRAEIDAIELATEPTRRSISNDPLLMRISPTTPELGTHE